MNADAEQPRVRHWQHEVAGAAAALSIAIATVAVVASGPRSELLFRDADSVVTTLVVRSLAAGQPQDWAMSSVLFLPETAMVALLTPAGLGIPGTLALAAVVNLAALYGALRVAVGSRGRSSAPVAGALLGLGAFCVFAVTGGSASRDALEPASLLLTTTYYSATVIAAVLVVGIARRGLETPRRGWTGWTIATVAAASVLTNPLFAAWASLPLIAVLAFVSRRRGSGAPGLIVALAGGSVVGFVLRMPLAGLIANTGAGYADPSRALESLGYYVGLAAERWASPGGAVAVVAGVALWLWCGAAAVLLARRRETGAFVVAAFGAVAPLLVVVGAILLGTHAARYLQPIAFAPILGLVVLPQLGLRARPTAPTRGARVALAASAAVALVLAGAIGIPRIAASATAPDPDLDCVVAWTDASGRTGAGQFWTVRLPKAHVADPRSLVQVDYELRGYAWLVNRADFEVGEVTFLVLDAQSVEFDLPDGASLQVPTPPPGAAGASPGAAGRMGPAELIPCGRYTIADFGERALPLGPQRS